MFSHGYAALAGLACIAGAAIILPAQAQEQESVVLSLEEAFTRSLQTDPRLFAAAEAARAADAAIQQAGRRPNPTLDASLESFGGTDAYQLFDRAEFTVGLSQRLELGGDRQARTELAEQDARAVRLGGEVSRQALLYEVELAYLDAQRIAAELGAAAARLALAREIASSVDRRVEAARDPLMARARSQALVADAEIEVERLGLDGAAAREHLASYWLGAPDFVVDLQSFEKVNDAPVEAGTESPAIAQARANEARAQAAIEVERARAKSDVTISGGVRWFSEFDEPALVVGVSVPLRFWDNNSGNIARTAAERQQAMYETAALRRALDRELSSARSQVAIARSEISMIDERLIPAAENAAASAQDGYQRGGFSYLDVLEAQRVLSQARTRRISALTTYHRARAALTHLSGRYGELALPQELPQ